MKIIYLASASPDLRWFKQYYMRVFPAGRENADKHFLATQTTLKNNPLIGHPSESVAGAREFSIARTPFSFIYRVQEDRIEVLRVIDNRSDWSSEK